MASVRTNELSDNPFFIELQELLDRYDFGGITDIDVTVETETQELFSIGREPVNIPVNRYCSISIKTDMGMNNELLTDIMTNVPKPKKKRDDSLVVRTPLFKRKFKFKD